MNLDRIRDYILKENQYLVISTAPKTYYGFKVIRRQSLILSYNFATETTNITGPMSPYTGPDPVAPTSSTSSYQSSMSGYQSYYVELNKLPLGKIQSISDVFKIEDANQIYQVFMGIAPSYLRIGLRLNTTSTTSIEQNIALSQSFLDLFNIDGYTSPFNEPSPESEFFVLKPLTVGLTLVNPVSVPINPRLQFFINRLMVEPIPQNIQAAILSNSIPAKKVSIGGVTQNFSMFGEFSNYLMGTGGVCNGI
jgi:hypothetical protein